MFGQQRIPNNPDYSHTFATFVKLSWPGTGPCSPFACLEAHTISWLPPTMNVRTFALRPECGHNFDLDTTIRWAISNDMRTSLWGPFQIRPELYGLAMRQVRLLEAGGVMYKVIDLGRGPDQVCNCSHAVDGVVNGSHPRISIPVWGEMASYLVLRRMDSWIINRDCIHPNVGAMLGLNQYPIIYRGGQDPHSGTIQGPFHRLLGGERCLRPSYGLPNP